MLYYRKFGFEIGCFGKQCQYLLSMIPSFDMKGGYFVLVDESNRKQVLSDVKQLYGAWEVKYNGMIHNEGYEYAFVTESIRIRIRSLHTCITVAVGSRQLILPSIKRCGTRDRLLSAPG